MRGLKRAQALLLALLVTGAVQAQDTTVAAPSEAPPPLTDAEKLRAAEMTLNVVQFAVLHEMGHMMVGEFGLPVLGFSEDAADNFAIQILLKTFPDDANDTLRDTMRSWFLQQASDNAASPDPADMSAYYDEHSLSVQRGYAILCQMVGSSQERYGALATSYGMDENRQDTCDYDYGLAEDGWTQLLVPHSIGAQAAPEAATSDQAASGDESDPDTWAGGDPTQPITVSYEDEEDADLQSAAEMLKASGVLESSADAINRGYAMPRPIGLNARSCDDGPNLDYSQGRAEIEVCYEFIAMMSNMVAADMQANPGNYDDIIGPMAIPVTPDLLDYVWIVKGVTPGPSLSVSAVVEDDPQFMNAWVALASDRFTWTKPGAEGKIDASIDNCEAPAISATATDGYFTITCSGSADRWGEIAVVDDDHLTLKWRDGAILSLEKTPGYSSDETVWGYVEQNSILTRLFAALKAAGLDATMDGPGPVTLLAPTDAAFMALPPGMLDSLMQPGNAGALKKLLGCHVIDRAFSTDEVPTGDIDAKGEPLTVTTMSGCALTFQVQEVGGITITDENGIGASLVYQDVNEANGSLQVIDAVLTPKSN